MKLLGVCFGQTANMEKYKRNKKNMIVYDYCNFSGEAVLKEIAKYYYMIYVTCGT